MFGKLANVLSLASFDAPWRSAVESSMVVRAAGSFNRLLGSTEVEWRTKAGNFLQSVGFCFSLVLYIALALPQFANDKEGLALISLAGFSAWLLGYVLGGKERRQSTMVDALVLLFFAANIIATAASHYLMPSVRGLSKDAVYIISYFYLTAVLNNAPKRKVILCSVLLLAALGVSLYGLYQFKIGVQPLATWEDPTVETKGTRIFSTFGNPNLLAGYLVPLMPLAVAMGLGALSSKKYLAALPYLGVGAIIAVATVLTGSRGGYFGLGVSALALAIMVASKVWVSNKKLRPVIIVLCILLPVAAAGALHFVPSFEQRISSVFAGSEHSSNAYRMNVWRSSFEMLKDNWWFGIGPGNQAFRLAYGLYMKSGFDALGTYCVPLEVGVECGVFGLAIFGAILAATFSRAHKAFWGNQSGMQPWITAGAAAALFGMMVHGMVDTVFYRPQVQFIFWLLLALVLTDPFGAKRLQEES